MSALEEYPLSYSEAEAKRLPKQATMIEDSTNELLGRELIAWDASTRCWLGVGDGHLMAHYCSALLMIK